MNYTEMLFNRDERLVNLLNQADSKNLELIEKINNREEEIERLNNIINKYDIFLKHELSFEGHSEEWIENKLQELKGVYKE